MSTTRFANLMAAFISPTKVKPGLLSWGRNETECPSSLKSAATQLAKKRPFSVSAKLMR